MKTPNTVGMIRFVSRQFLIYTHVPTLDMKLNFIIIFQNTQFKVMSKKEATESYKHILRLGEFKMFEFIYENN